MGSPRLQVKFKGARKVITFLTMCFSLKGRHVAVCHSFYLPLPHRSATFYYYIANTQNSAITCWIQFCQYASFMVTRQCYSKHPISHPILNTIRLHFMIPCISHQRGSPHLYLHIKAYHPNKKQV